MAAAVQDIFSSSLATEDEKAIIAKMRANLSKEIETSESAAFPEVTGDINLLRFLRGQGGDQAKAEEFFTKMLAWRKLKNVDAIRKLVHAAWQKAGGAVENLFTHTYLPHADIVLKHYPERYYHKTDSIGNPVKITRHRFISDYPGLMKALGPAEYYEFRLARGELRSILLQELSVKQNRLVKITYVWDLAGMDVGYWSLLRSKEVQAYAGDYDDSSRDCYPEIAHKILGINTPWFLNVIWKAAKVMLPERTVSKIDVMGSDYANGITKYIKKSDLPDVMSGECQCPDGCFPNNWLTVVVNRGAKNDLDYPVTAGATISWEFQSKGHDIAFAAKFIQADKTEVNIQDTTRCNSSVTTRGSYVVPVASAGTVKITFDNSFSWFTAKTIHYNIQVEELRNMETDKQLLSQDPLLASPQAGSPQAEASAVNDLLAG